MNNRYSNAVAIQEGACNIPGIARSLVAAADDARKDGVQPADDPAVRLIIHQLAFLSQVGEIEDNNTVYADLLNYCVERAKK